MLSLSRRDLLRLSAGAAVTGAAYTVTVTASAPPAEAAVPSPARQFRAMWIATVENIDYPSRTGLSEVAQRAEVDAWMDLARRWNLNAVISQVRPSADAFWPSPHEPWSRYLSGTQGRSPGYDVLAFQVDSAHRRNLEFHAWFNPYRVANHADPSRLTSSHPARIHPEWVFSYAGKLYYNPGIPEVRSFVQTAMMHAVERYDIDAVHFDDYFYPYPVDGKAIPDSATHAKYGAGKSLADWRRANVDTLIREMRDRIRAVKPWVRFGISPFGIWRNRSSDPLGSATSGTESYSAISADSRRWVTHGWIDYICPQLYWQIGLSVADYAVLTAWWADVVSGTDVALYIGQGTYKSTSGVFTDARELTRHLELNREHAAVRGDAHFSASDLKADARGAVSTMIRDHYSRPAIVPRIAHLGGQAPPAPGAVRVSRRGPLATVHWRRPSSPTTSYAIWRLPDADASAARLADGANLLATVRADGATDQTYVDRGAPAGAWYTVTAYDRLWNQSPPAPPVR